MPQSQIPLATLSPLNGNCNFLAVPAAFPVTDQAAYVGPPTPEKALPRSIFYASVGWGHISRCVNMKALLVDASRDGVRFGTLQIDSLLISDVGVDYTAADTAGNAAVPAWATTDSRRRPHVDGVFVRGYCEQLIFSRISMAGMDQACMPFLIYGAYANWPSSQTNPSLLNRFDEISFSDCMMGLNIVQRRVVIKEGVNIGELSFYRCRGFGTINNENGKANVGLIRVYDSPGIDLKEFIGTDTKIIQG